MNSNDKEIVNLRQLSCFISHHVHCFGFPTILGFSHHFLDFPAIFGILEGNCSK